MRRRSKNIYKETNQLYFIYSVMVYVLCVFISVFSLLHVVMGKKNSLCSNLPNHAELTKVLENARSADVVGPLPRDHVAAIASMDGKICAVTKSGKFIHQDARINAMVKAFTGTMRCVENFALSTANLYRLGVSPNTPAGNFRTLIPTSLEVLKKYKTWNTKQDYMVGKVPGGQALLAGGVCLYKLNDKTNAVELIGAIGVAGAATCSDHNIAWYMRELMGYDANLSDTSGVGGVSQGKDRIIYDTFYDTNGVWKSKSGSGTPECNAVITAKGVDLGAAILDK